MLDTSALRFYIEPMREDDLDAVMAIEYDSFTAPWSARAYAHELTRNSRAHYFVARPYPRIPPVPPVPVWRKLVPFLLPTTSRVPLVGYGGFWILVDEAHISTIAVARERRRRGIGELLLAAMIDRAIELHARLVTLEVRASNHAAIALYRKYGFEVNGGRKRYYQDDREDALIMSTPLIQGEAYRAHWRENATVLLAGLAR